MGNTGKRQHTEHDISDNTWAARARPLRECGDIATTRLALALSDALKQAGDQLFARGAAEPAGHEQRSWLDAADFIRARRQEVVDAFRKHFQRRYDRACRHAATSLSVGVVDFDHSQLRIVAHDRLDDHLDPSDLVDAIRNGTWSSLHELTGWFRAMLADPDLAPVDTPLGPKLLGNAIAEAISEQYRGPEAMQRVLRALGRALPDRVNQVYRDINDYHSSGIPLALEPAFPEPADSMPPADAAVADRVADADREAAALATAGAVVASQIAAIKVPGFITDFLSGPWRGLLAKIHHEHGEDSPAWEAALGTMDDLVWSLRPKPTEDRARLMRTLPELVRRLREGLANLEGPEEGQEEFFARLAECHVRLLASAKASEARAEPPPAPPASDDAWLDGMEAGVWIALAAENGETQELKLAWVSPHRKLFLLTNQRGERALSLNAKDLASRLRDGLARPIPAPRVERGNDQETHSSADKKTA
jgi:hypothetical protein